MTAPKVGAWLSTIRQQQPLFSKVGVIDMEIQGLVPLMMLVEDWTRHVGADLQIIQPSTIKRIAKGPYATRRDVLEWANGILPHKRKASSYEQAAAVAGYLHLGSR